MLEFTSAPYQFFEPQPLKPVIWLAKPINRLLLRFDLKVVDLEINGDLDRVRQLLRQGSRILFTPNHPTRTDAQFMGEIHRRLGTHSSFMGAYDVFLENKVQCWFMQKTGCFSIDREGNDRKSMATAIDILKTGDMSLTIFPEGNVYHLNDRVTPILDGPSFIAAKTQQTLRDEAEVWIVPVSLKYTQVSDVRKRLWPQLEKVKEDSAYSGVFDQSAPLATVRSMGAHLISTLLKEKRGASLDLDFTDSNQEEIMDSILSVAWDLIAELEEELGLESDDSVFILNRIRKIRSRVHQLRTQGDYPSEEDRRRYRNLADRSIFAFRLLGYVLPYLGEKPTIDRFAETVARIREDYYSESFKSSAPRKAMAQIGEPISVQQILQDVNGKTKLAIPKISRRIETALQAGIDKLNRNNQETGALLMP